MTLFAGSDMAERREILARLSPLYLAVEGGPGTVHEGRVAIARLKFSFLSYSIELGSEIESRERSPVKHLFRLTSTQHWTPR